MIKDELDEGLVRESAETTVILNGEENEDEEESFLGQWDFLNMIVFIWNISLAWMLICIKLNKKTQIR